MADQDTISRIGKILARATSDNSNEAEAALKSAYARMQRDGVTVRDLLTLPLQELYQDALVRLIELIVQDQTDLSQSSRRELYARYLQMVVGKFSGGTGGGATPEPPPCRETSSDSEKEFKRKNTNTSGESYQTTGTGVSVFFSSLAGFFSFLKVICGRGSFLWHVAHYPIMTLRLFAVSVIFGSAVAVALLMVAGIFHSITHTAPILDLRLQYVFSFLTALGSIWKTYTLYRAGWFS